MSGLVRRAKKAFLDADIDLLNDDIRLVLIDLGDIVGTHCRVITAATNASPAVCTSASHGFSNGDVVSISGATGNTNINGLRVIASQATNTFQLTDINGTAINGNGTFGGTCYAVNLTTIDFYDDIVAGLVGSMSSALTSKNTDNGRFDFADVTFSSVTGDPSEAVFLINNTPGTNATKHIIAIDDQASNLPVTPNGGDIVYAVNANGMFDL